MNTTTLEGSDGFLYVSYKGKKKKKNFKQPFCSSSPDFMQNFDTVLNNIYDEVKHSDFTTKFKEDLYSVLQEWNLGYILSHDNNVDSPDANNVCVNKEQEIDIVCYGLGQFSSCIIARYQLGFLLVLKHIFQSTQVYIYDPQFSVEEIDFLNKLHLNVLKINEEAKRPLTRKSVFFMPHCDLPLYNNLLWANWNMKSLSELAIIGNSFQSYEMNDAKQQLKEKAKYVYLANQFVTEIRMPNVFRFTDIFNDLSIHYFKSSSLSLIDSQLWSDLEEPEYSDEDIIKSI